MDFKQLFNTFVEMTVSGLLTVLSGFLIALAKELFSFLKSKVQKNKSEILKNTLSNALDILQSTVETTVVSLQQTIGDDIKESLRNKDGKYTREDLLALKDKAFQIIVDQVDVAILDTVNTVYDDLEGYINNLIEVSVRKLKESSNLPQIPEENEPQEKVYLAE